MCRVIKVMNNSVFTMEDEAVISWKGEGHGVSGQAVRFPGGSGWAETRFLKALLVRPLVYRGGCPRREESKDNAQIRDIQGQEQMGKTYEAH